MSLMQIPMLPSGDVAYILRRNLGPDREWADFLTDCRRGKTTYFDLTLLPQGQVRVGRSKRPLYSIRDVDTFVRAAQMHRPPTGAEAKYHTVQVELDPSDPRDWQHRSLTLVA